LNGQSEETIIYCHIPTVLNNGSHREMWAVPYTGPAMGLRSKQMHYKKRRDTQQRGVEGPDEEPAGG
jgi:hypothetical protein